MKQQIKCENIECMGGELNIKKKKNKNEANKTSRACNSMSVIIFNFNKLLKTRKHVCRVRIESDPLKQS